MLPTTWQPPPVAMYAQWRRRLEEAHFVYGRRPVDHACWAEPAASNGIEEVVRRTGLYGCTRCGRSHYCQPPYLWCPRVVDPQTGEAHCGFSAHVLGTDAAVAMVPGGFHLENAALHAMEEQRARDRDDSVRREENRLFSLGHGASLRTGANYTTNMHKRQRLMARAETSDTTRATVHDARQFLRLRADADADVDADTAGGGGDYATPDEAAAHPTFFGGADRGSGDEDDHGPGFGGGDEDGGGDDYAPSVTVTAADLAPVVPPLELERDDAYLPAYLAPVVAALAPFAALFRSATGGGTDPAVSQPAASAPRRLRLTLWPVMSAARVAHAALLTHQQAMLRHIEAFVVAAARALSSIGGGGGGGAAPLDARAYLVLCDRLLLLHNSVVEPAESFDRDKEPELARLVQVMLTSVFSANYYRRDSAHQALLFVWLADPWLKRCRAAGLFADEALRPAAARAGGSGGKSRRPAAAAHGQWAPLLLDVLNRAPVSGHELYHYFHTVRPCTLASDRDD